MCGSEQQREALLQHHLQDRHRRQLLLTHPTHQAKQSITRLVDRKGREKARADSNGVRTWGQIELKAVENRDRPMHIHANSLIPPLPNTLIDNACLCLPDRQAVKQVGRARRASEGRGDDGPPARVSLRVLTVPPQRIEEGSRQGQVATPTVDQRTRHHAPVRRAQAAAVLLLRQRGGGGREMSETGPERRRQTKNVRHDTSHAISPPCTPQHIKRGDVPCQ